MIVFSQQQNCDQQSGGWAKFKRQRTDVVVTDDEDLGLAVKFSHACILLFVGRYYPERPAPPITHRESLEMRLSEPGE